MRFLALVAYGIEDEREVVGDESIAGPLGEEADGKDDREAQSVAFGLEEGCVGGAAIGLVFQADGGADLLELDNHDGVAGVRVPVVPADDVARFVDAVFGHQPSGRLDDPEEAEDLDHGRERLEQRGDSPRPVRADAEGAVRCP